MRACWLKWVGRDWSISADYIWLNYSDANNDSPSSVSSESASNATDSPKPENDVSAVFGSVSYQTHVQDIGWQAPVSNGMTAGTTGRAKRVEALKINLLSQDGTPLGNDSISVQSHISGIG